MNKKDYAYLLSESDVATAAMICDYIIHKKIVKKKIYDYSYKYTDYYSMLVRHSHFSKIYIDKVNKSIIEDFEPEYTFIIFDIENKLEVRKALEILYKKLDENDEEKR